MKTESERLVRRITLCPRCYEEKRRTPLVFDRDTRRIRCQEGKHEWVPEEWLSVIERRRK